MALFWPGQPGGPVRVTAVIPAFNEEARVGITVEAAAQYVDEVLVIDDGSRDDTAAAAARAGARVLQQWRNQGYIAAIKRGFAEAVLTGWSGRSAPGSLFVCPATTSTE